VKLWDLASGRELRTLEGHTNEVTSVALNGARGILASGSWDKTVKLWDLKSGTQLAELAIDNSVSALSFFGERGLAVASSARVVLYDHTLCSLVLVLQALPNSHWIIYTPGGHYVGSRDIEKQIEIAWQLSDGIQTYPSDLLPRENPNPEKVREALDSLWGKPVEQNRTAPAPISGRRVAQIEAGDKTQPLP
jgi:WD40 repeat protein